MENVLPEWAHDTLSVSTIRVSGAPIVYLHGGSGPPVVMVHGLGGSLDWWQKNVAELSRHFTLYLVDLPGFGRLGHLEDSRSIPDFVDWIMDFINAIGLTKTHLIGHSMGGHLAIRLAAAWPERFDRLVLVAPAGVLPDAELVHYILPVIKLLRELPPSLLPLALRDVRRADLRTTWRSAHHLIEHDVLHLLADVQSPVC